MHIDKNIFLSAITAIDEQKQRDKTFAENMSKCFPNTFEGNLLYNTETIIDAMINLLQEATHDTHGWVEHFVYELDFGRKTHIAKVKIDDKEYPLTSAEELYNLLTS